jgi:hypothetical protein
MNSSTKLCHLIATALMSALAVNGCVLVAHAEESARPDEVNEPALVAVYRSKNAEPLTPALAAGQGR